MKMLRRLLPDSLVARVYALYAMTWIAIICGGVTLFYQVQFAQKIDDAYANATMMIELASLTVRDSAVIGDYDTIKRTLKSSILRSPFASAQYIDLAGGSIRAVNSEQQPRESPRWLHDRISERLSEVNRNISAGGRDYGVLRLTFDSNQIANQIWQWMEMAAFLGVASLVGGLLLIWFPLRHWLGALDQPQIAELGGGVSIDSTTDATIDDRLISNAPREFRQTMLALKRTSDRLSTQLAERESALLALRRIIANLMPEDAREAATGESISTMISTLSTLVKGSEEGREQLRQAKDAAEAANIAKSRFLATMSHEIRTPMNAILGMAQVLLMPNIKESERLDYARTIVNSGQSLLSLINDILDLSKIEAGKVSLESITFEPAHLVDETMQLFAEMARSKGLKLTTQWHGPNRLYLGDPHRLRQMLSNLVGNAVKFTARGQILIKAQEVACNAHSALLEFAVLDTGPGIAKDKQALLFQSFSQADSSTTRNYGGTGLGLSIVRNLAQLMDGKVGLQSEEGRGSRFWFRVRAGLAATEVLSDWGELPQAVSQPTVSRPPQLAGRVLVVEDNPLNQKVLGELLRRLGLDFAMANDGQCGLDAIMQGEPADLILMDLQMPVMDGFAATRQIRQWEASTGRRRIPIIALTASAFLEDRVRCQEAGMDDFTLKPIELPILIKVLTKWLPQPGKPAAHPTAPTQTARALDKTAVMRLLQEILPLLAHNKFDAMGVMRKLKAAVAGTEMETEIAEVAQLLEGFRFDLALQRISQLMASGNWKEDFHG